LNLIKIKWFYFGQKIGIIFNAHKVAYVTWTLVVCISFWYSLSHCFSIRFLSANEQFVFENDGKTTENEDKMFSSYTNIIILINLG
jgi:hypothetical protein